MKDQLPAPRFDAGQYERPNQKWVCGKAAEGSCCRVGPDSKGHCRASHECRPFLELQPGEAKGTYKCTRTPEFGGPCESGPRPDGTCCRPITRCQPARSLRHQRKLLTQATVIFTVAILLIALGGGHWEKAISPGPISAAHSSLAFARMHRAGQNTRTDCGACHAAAGSPLAEWPAKALGANPGPAEFGKLVDVVHPGFNAIDESCQKCHQGHKFHEPNVVQDHSCSACHREHEGSGTMRPPEDSNCQTCHANRSIMSASLEKGRQLPAASFDYRPDQGRVLFKAPRPDQGYTQVITAFSKDHPEFQVLREKLKDPNTLRFNHELHLASANVHDEQGLRLQCATCHQPDATGAYYQPISYQKNCQSCHQLQFDERNPGLILPHGNPEFARAFIRSLPEQYADYARTKKGLSARDEVDGFVQKQMLIWGTKVNSAEELERQIFLNNAYTGITVKVNGEDKLAHARYPGCAYCHEVTPGAGQELPKVTRPVLINRWLIRGRFDHSKHTIAGADRSIPNMACDKCHEVTHSSKTSDVLLPSQTTCSNCHSPQGGVANSCSTCHSYHAPAGDLSLGTVRK